MTIEEIDNLREKIWRMDITIEDIQIILDDMLDLIQGRR